MHRAHWLASPPTPGTGTREATGTASFDARESAGQSLPVHLEVSKLGTVTCRNQVLNSVEIRYSILSKTGTVKVMADQYVSRLVDGLLDQLLVSFSATSLVGPHAAGKTTTAVLRAGTVLAV